MNPLAACTHPGISSAGLLQRTENSNDAMWPNLRTSVWPKIATAGELHSSLLSEELHFPVPRYSFVSYFIYLLTELSPSWGAVNCAAPQELPSILWNLKVQYRVHKSPPLVPILSHRSFIQGIRRGPRLLENFRNKLIFYGEELLAPRPNPKLQDHPLSAVSDCLFNIFAAALQMKAIAWHYSSAVNYMGTLR
jgi:hypothetical protein